MIKNYRNTLSRGDTIDEHIIGIVLLFGLFLPHIGMFLLFNPIAVLFLAFKYWKIETRPRLHHLIIATLTFSLLYYIFVTRLFNIQALSRAIVLIELFLFFPFVKNVRILNFYTYFALFYIFISQVSYMIGNSQLISFYNTYYPYEGDQSIYKSSFLQHNAHKISLINRNFRLGGLFKNPNQCAKYISIILTVFLIENKKLTYIKKLPFIILTFIAVIATGSRTGLFISTLLLLADLFLNYLKNSSIRRKLTVASWIFVALVIYFMFFVDYNFTKNIRSLDVNEGIQGSLIYKWKFFVGYLNAQSSEIQHLFGCFDSNLVREYITSTKHMDSEWGEAVFTYGFIFLFLLIIFYYRVFNRLQPSYRIYFIVLFWAISSTILFSYRTSFVFMLLLSKYAYQEKKTEHFSNLKLNKYEI